MEVDAAWVCEEIELAEMPALNRSNPSVCVCCCSWCDSEVNKKVLEVAQEEGGRTGGKGKGDEEKRRK